MIDAGVITGTVGAIFGGSASWIAMGVARSSARESSELGFIRKAKLAIFLVVGVALVLQCAAGQILWLDDELSVQERHGYLALPVACFLTSIVVSLVAVLIENSRRKRVTREGRIEPRSTRVRAGSGSARGANFAQLPKTLRPPVQSFLKPAAGACILIAWGAYKWPHSPVGGGLMFMIGGLFFMISVASMLSARIFLKIDDQKFTISHLFAARTVAFGDIAAFETYAAERGRKVGWKYRAGMAPTKVRKLNLRLLGVDDSLGSNFGLSADQLCGLMNDTLELSQRKYPKREFI